MRRTLALTLLAVGCAHAQPVAPAEPNAPVAPVRFARALLDTTITLELAGPASPEVEALAQRAYAEAERVEAQFSEVSAGGQLSRVNANAGLSPVKLDADVFGLLQVTKLWSERTRGAFDVTATAMPTVWKVPAEGSDAPAPQPAVMRRAPGDYRKLVLDAKAQTAFLKETGMTIALGDVARAYAVDRMARALRDAGQHDFRLEAGGALYFAGRDAGEARRVELRNPLHPDEVLGTVEVVDEAFHASSADESRRARSVVEPRTGNWVEGATGTFVFATRCTDAEALTQALFFLEPKDGFPIVHAAGAEGVFVAVDGTVYATDTLARRIRFREGVKVTTVPKTDNF